MRWTSSTILVVGLVMTVSCTASTVDGTDQAADDSISSSVADDSGPADDEVGEDGDAHRDPSGTDPDESDSTSAATVTTTADQGGAGSDEAADDDDAVATGAADDDDAVATGAADAADDDDAVVDGAAPVLVPSGRGDSGPEVEALQTRLNEIGFSAGTPDGEFGRRTERAVLSFQQVSGLVQTGRLNLPTIDALETFHYDGLAVSVGDEGPRVEELQQLLATGPFDPGAPDGEYGTRTVQAVWALEKMAGIPVDGDWGPADDWAFNRLMQGRLGAPVRSHDRRWVEIDLSQQVMKVYDPGRTVPVLVSHVSSGNGIPWENENHRGSSVTPKGDFAIQRRISGWRESSLDIGRLYNPLYFRGGIALHGALSVPNYPASHGCVRVPMHIAEYLPGELPNGTPVHVMS